MILLDEWVSLSVDLSWVKVCDSQHVFRYLSESNLPTAQAETWTERKTDIQFRILTMTKVQRGL